MIVGNDADSTWWKQEKKTEDIESREAQDIIGPDPEEEEDDGDIDMEQEEEMEVQPEEEIVENRVDKEETSSKV